MSIYTKFFTRPLFLDKTENGCTGTQTVTASVDSMTNPTSISGSFTFTNYSNFASYPPTAGVCDGDVMNGSITFSGVKSGSNTVTSITFTGFTSVHNSETATVNGTISVTTALNGLTGSMTANMTATRKISGVVTDTLALTGFSISRTLSNGGKTLTFSESGTIAYDDKSFTITTVTPIVVTDIEFDDHPSSGVIILDANGRARVTFVSVTNVMVEVDPLESGVWVTAYAGTWDDLMTLTGLD